jgi:tetratricopeptide (TPR) repeat protein
VLGPGGDFLTEWASRIDGGNGATDARHPAFRERSRVLRAQLTAIEQDLPFYRFGLRLSSLGRYDDAIRLLERFHSQFPSRETGANLGLAYYGRALGRLRDCGLRDGLRFRLATLVDPETLATRVRLRGDGSARCVASARDDLALAEQRLRDASEADPRHLPARLNLAVVLLAAGKGLEAYRVAAGTSDPPAGVHASLPDVRLATVAAVALHMAGRELPLDTTDAALEALREIDGRLGPRDLEQRAAIAFNRGRINQERGRNAAAREAWEALLALEPQGVWADEARLALLAAGVNPLVPDPGTVASLPRATLASRFSVSLQQRLARAKRRPFTLGDLKGCFVSGEDVAAMEIGGVLEIVEEGLRPPVDMAAVEREIGRPRIVVDALGGQQTRVYRDVAYDVVPAGGIIRVLFEPR